MPLSCLASPRTKAHPPRVSKPSDATASCGGAGYHRGSPRFLTEPLPTRPSGTHSRPLHHAMSPSPSVSQTHPHPRCANQGPSRGGAGRRKRTRPPTRLEKARALVSHVAAPWWMQKLLATTTMTTAREQDHLRTYTTAFEAGGPRTRSHPRRTQRRLCLVAGGMEVATAEPWACRAAW